MTPGMNPLLRQLTGGDRRSIGAARAVVKLVLNDLRRFPVVLNGMTNPDPLLRMRCSDVVEKVTTERPGVLAPYRARMLDMAAAAQQQEVRWHLAQVLPRLLLDAGERRRVLDILAEYLRDKSSIVRTFSMQAMAEIAEQDPQLRTSILRQLEELTQAGSPAMRSRGRKLIARLKEVQRSAS